MSDVLVFLASCVADLWDLFYTNFPRDYFAYTLLLFIIGLVVSRLILPIIAVNESQFFGRGVVNERIRQRKKAKKDKGGD